MVCYFFVSIARYGLKFLTLGYELNPESAHHFIRRTISQSLRSEHYWQINVLLGGWDNFKQQAFLSSIDYLGNGIPKQA